MKLKVDMYVRYRYYNLQKIAKIDFIKQDELIHEELICLDKGGRVFKSEILNASDNPIDLIEVGDYVNGYKVVRIFTNVFNNQKVLVCSQKEKEEDFDYSDDISDYMSDEFIHIYNEDIKSIVTKEQFNSVKYEVE